MLLSQKQESRLPRPVSTRRGVVERSTAGGYSPCTVKLIRGVLGQAVGQAERWGMVARNVVALTEGPRVAPSESRTLTPQQARALLDAANGERLEAAFVLLLCLGLRKGEAFSLRWADIDFDNSVVTVGPTVSRVEIVCRRLSEDCKEPARSKSPTTGRIGVERGSGPPIGRTTPCPRRLARQRPRLHYRDGRAHRPDELPQDLRPGHEEGASVRLAAPRVASLSCLDTPGPGCVLGDRRGGFSATRPPALWTTTARSFTHSLSRSPKR